MRNSQELANAIKSVAKEKKIAIGQMLSDCNLSVNTLSSMKSGGYYPRIEALASIADYLGCSMDYLLGRSALDVPELDELEQQLVSLSRRLNPEGRERLLETADDMVASGKYKKYNPIELGLEA